jgi:hypothetical protein
MAALTTATRTIIILAGATVRSDWMGGVESRIHADITVEARRSNGRWVYELNGREYSCDSSSETFAWV